jgi:acyl dehydratase
VLCYPGLWMRDTPDLGIDFTRIVHGEQSTWLHRPIPVGVPLVGRSRVTRVVDKGEGKGALLVVEKLISLATSGEPVVRCEQVIFCRGDGGFSAQGVGSDMPGEALQATPDSPPDLVLQMTTRPEMALIYRLSGDLNPLHSDPAFARRAGFDRPILHGLATYGVACHGLLKAYCNYDPSHLKSIRARFSAPAFPGDSIELAFWHRGPDIAFRATVPARQVTVLSHGRAVCAA